MGIVYKGIYLAPRTPIYDLGIMASLSLGLMQGSGSMGIVYKGIYLAPRTPVYGLGIMASLSLGLLQGSSSMGIVYRVYVSSLSSDSGHLLRQRKAR
jgi:uncharacterized membrane protein